MRHDDVKVAVLGVGAIAVVVTMTGCAGSPSGDETSIPPSSTTYEDGVYEARGWYGGLPSHHDVTLTIEDDVVTDVAITTPAEDETSLGYQQRFAQALPDAVIGRPIDGLEIDRLAGSSGCSEGFMDALEKIKTQARN
ncbi:hypothetical protein GCM10009775_08120 [Microbacterium aoyamense]|uniref:FMN-binding domain-containing protein n=1 Tax=Microbacterium aoyamense TaxID=344166 RepID=A0ABP5APC3_9MICO|nr:hypothetical protein [Microbacterium aoyamense]